MNEDKEKPTVFHFKPKPKDENHAGPNQHENQAKTRSAIKKKEKMWRDRNQCKGASKVWFRHNGSVCKSWSCGESTLANCHLNGGRNWPGMIRLIDFKGCDGTPANFPFGETIWSFFVRGAVEPPLE